VAARAGAPVARELDEVDGMRDRHGTREIGEEDDARLERRHQQWLSPRVVARDVGPELVHPRRDFASSEVDVADALVEGDYEARSRP
jgi:hypothetical protein